MVGAVNNKIPSLLLVIFSLFRNRIVSALILETPLTLPASMLTASSNTIEDPEAGAIFIWPEDVLIDTVLSPSIISSA